MGCVDQQLSLLLSRVTEATMHVPLEMIRNCRSDGSAFSLACTASGLEDKEIYIPLKIDAGTFSKIKSGKATFPVSKVRDFCELVRNQIYPEWVAYQVGCTLTMVLSEAERRWLAERERAEQAEAKLQMALDLMHGRKQ